MSRLNHYLTKAQSRKKRVSSKIIGTAERPRVAVKRANKYCYIQIIDDKTGKTLLSANDIEVRKNLKKSESMTKTESIVKATEALVKEMKKAKISTVVFDRGQYKYHGRVKAVAETLRNGGIKV